MLDISIGSAVMVVAAALRSVSYITTGKRRLVNLRRSEGVVVESRGLALLAGATSEVFTNMYILIVSYQHVYLYLSEESIQKFGLLSLAIAAPLA